jgi:diguanylate cyclase (GGDEF)-like protein
VASWDDAVAELRGEYLREAPERVARGTAALVRLRAGHDDAAQDLALAFHGFAGSGKTYGFARVSELGHEGEVLCGTLGVPATPEQLSACAALLEGIRTALAGPQAPPAPEIYGSSAPAELPAAQVLVIEADVVGRTQLRRALEQEGLRVQEVGTLAEAEAALAAGLPDGVVADTVLPDGEIYALVERLRARPAGEDLPLVIVSVQNDVFNRVEAIHCGADAYFAKPADLEDVARRMAFLLGRRRPEPARVLSVEDDPLQAAFLRTVLESAGYAFDWCSEPKDLDARIATFQPELVLMDVMLPGATGYDLARLLRQDERHALLPIVFLTTQGQMRDRLEASRAGGSDHLLKPVNPEALLTTVAARLEQARFLRSLVDRDGLTGLLNHTALFQRGEGLAAEARRRGLGAAWIMIDVDHFKGVNDRYGHPVGDRVLRALGSLLRRRLRQSDVLGRYGGEEFAVVVSDLTVREAVRLVDRVRLEFAAMPHASAEDQHFQVTFSAGVAALTSEMRVSDWSKLADERLYEAKAAGRNRVVPAPGP